MSANRMNRSAAGRVCLVLLAVALPLTAVAQQWGIQVRNAQGGAGAEVISVSAGTPAESAEIRLGDIIVRAQGRTVANAFQFTQATQSVQAGGTLEITVSRQGWEREVRLTMPPSLLSFGLTVRDGPAGSGSEIASVVPDGPAAAAGLRPGDLVIGAEGRKIVSVAVIGSLLEDYAAQSRPLTLTVARENWAKDVTIAPKAMGVAADEASGTQKVASNAATLPSPRESPPQSAAPSRVTPGSTALRDAPAAAPAALVPDRADVIADLGNGNRAYELQNWTDAETYFKRVLQAVPDEPRAWGRLCHAQVMQARFSDAVEACRRAVQFAPRDASVLQNIGYSLFRLGKHPESIGWYQKAIDIRPDWPQPYSGIGAAQFALGNWAKAEDAYKLVVARDPMNQSAWQSLGDVAGEQDKPADSIAHYRKAQALGPANAELYRSLGWQLSKAGRLVDAEAALLEASRLNPKDVNTLVSLGLVEDKLGNIGQAQQAWQRAVELDPDGSLGSIARQNLAALATRPAQSRAVPVAAPVAPAAAQGTASRAESPAAPRPPEIAGDQPLPIDDPDIDAGK
jgi:tetratricopeptide (TPR) repeat protein